MTIFSRYIKAVKALAFKANSIDTGLYPIARSQLWFVRWCIAEGERAMWWQEKYFVLKNKLRRK